MIVLDLETVPGIPLDSVAYELAGLADAGQPPRSIAECDELACTYASLTPALAKIAVAGFHQEVGGKIHSRAFVNVSAFGATAISETIISMEDEKELVERTFRTLEDIQRWPLVTFNGRRFDLPVLMAAALRHEIPIPAPVMSLMTEYRFAKNPAHVDLYDLLSNYGSCKGGLRALCIGIGLGDPKAGGDGTNVAEMVKAGKVAEVSKYCLSDCEFTSRLYQRYLKVKGS